MNISKNPLINLSLLKGRKGKTRICGEIVSAYLGRYALYRVLETLEVKPDEDILVPTYHCLTMVEPILRYGCRVGLYRMNMGLQTSVEDIRGAIGNNTKAVVLVHYFGLHQKETDKIKSYLTKNNIFLIEDCAHVIPIEGDAPGSLGDVSIYTPRKYLPIVDGAFIRINNPRLMNRIKNRAIPVYYELKNFKNICEQRLIAGNSPFLSRLYQKIDKKANWVLKRSGRSEVNENTEPSVEFNSTFTDMKCSFWAQYMMRTADFEGIYEKRINIFEYLFEAIYGRGLCKALEFLNEGRSKCVFGFPVMSSEKRRIIKSLREKKIETFTFGESLYHAEDLGENSDEVRLSKDLFFVPMNQDFGSRQLEYLSECLSEALRDSQ